VVIGRGIPGSTATRAAGGIGTRLDLAAWLATIALLALHIARLARFAVDWPLHDDFTQILAVPGYLAQMTSLAERLEYVFSLSVEHRIATLRLAGWIGSLLPGGLDFRLLIALGNGLGLVAGAILVLHFPRAHRAMAALVATLLLTSATHYGAQYWATGALQHFGVCAYAMVAIFAVARGHAIVAVMAASAAAFTAANGLMVVPAVVLLLALAGRRREAAVWAIAGAALFAWYFIGYETPVGRMSVVDVLRDPLRLATFGLATLGGIGDTFVPSVMLGGTIVAAWLALLVTGAWRRVPPAVVAAMLFFALTCAAIALGRAALGAEAVTLSRYRVYSASAILLTLAAVVPLARPKQGTVVLAVVAVLAAFVHVLGGMSSMPYMIELSSLQRVARDQYAFDGHGFFLGFPDAEFGTYTLRRARDIGAYHGARHASAPIVPTGGAPTTGGQPSIFSNHVHANARVVSVVGMMSGRHRAATLWLDDGRAAFRAELATVRCMGPEWHARSTVFRGTIDVGDLPAGRYRIGYDTGQGSGVSWTDRHVDLR
jgi:hypothetical protein